MSLIAESLVKTYRLPHAEVSVLRGASLRVEAGESVAIIGRSGAGKSTLLNVLGGLDWPQAGDVLIDGVSLYHSSGRVRNELRATKIGFVFQAYHLLPEMDIVENVMLPAMAHRPPPRGEMRRRAMDLLARVGLADRAQHRPLELSGGEQQRVALARALMNSPEVVLADEPTGNLDSATGTQTMDLLLELTASRGAALVMVTHSEAMAARCSRVLELKDGLAQ